MKLRRLEIEMERYGDNKGQYLGTLHFEDDKQTEVKLALTPEMAERFIEFSAPILMAAADTATEQFKTKLVQCLSYKQIAEPAPSA